MKFLTARHYAVGAERLSVLVQHYEYKGEQICFAGIEKGNDMTEQLYRWFREEILGIFLKKPRNCMKSVERSLHRKLKELLGGVTCKGEGDFSFALLLCKGEEFLALERGHMRILCFNTVFGKSNLNYLQEKGEQDLCYGSVEADVAFLLATDTFCEEIGDDLLREVLFVGETKREWQMEKRLRELVREKIREDITDGGVMLVRSCAETVEDMPSVAATQGVTWDVSEMVPVPEREESLHHDFIQRETLGEGAFSQVIKVQERRTGKIYACKKSQNISMLWWEYSVGRTLEHPLFPGMYDFWQDGEYGYLLMEFVPGTDVKHMLERRGHFSLNQTIRMGMDMAEGLLYLHEQVGFLFRDVKPENIIIRQDGRLKLLDLGCVCRRGAPANSRAGSPGFAAPEQFEEGKRPDVTCDIYGLARTMEEMLRPSGNKAKRLEKLLKQCTEEDPKQRIPDMRLLLNMLGEMLKGEVRGGKLLYKPGVLCHKNIWESSYKTLDVS